jgi:hypothetical protein
MEVLAQIFKQYGPWALLFIVLIYILLKGQFSFRYPRSNGRR